MGPGQGGRSRTPVSPGTGSAPPVPSPCPQPSPRPRPASAPRARPASPTPLRSPTRPPLPAHPGPGTASSGRPFCPPHPQTRPPSGPLPRALAELPGSTPPGPRVLCLAWFLFAGRPVSPALQKLPPEVSVTLHRSPFLIRPGLCPAARSSVDSATSIGRAAGLEPLRQLRPPPAREERRPVFVYL